MLAVHSVQWWMAMYALSLKGLISLIKGGKGWAGETKVKQQQKYSIDKWIKIEMHIT